MVVYKLSNLGSTYYHMWDSVWPSDRQLDSRLGYRDFALHEEFPVTQLMHAKYEMGWNDGPQLTRINRVYWWASIVVGFAYLALVYFGVKLMKNRKAFDLKAPLAIWNLFLAVFSFIGTARLLPHLLFGLWLNDSTYFFCRLAGEAYGVGPAGLWANLFVWSKYIELIDTVFLVLRKKPVSFLHWFHHATVLMYCWHAGQYQMPTGIFFATMNYVVHSVMYFYYFLAAVTTPPKWGKFVTVIQIVQMFGGMFVTGYHYYLLRTVPNCDGSHNNLMAAFLMYSAYMLLFVQFFVARYMGRKSVPAEGTKALRKKKE